MTTDKKQILETAITGLFGAGGVDAVEPHLSETFVDHGPGIKAANKAEWIAIAKQIPVADMKIEIRHMIAEDDVVAMVSRRWIPWEDRWIAVADVWRFEDDLIAEHGEIFQPVPESEAGTAATGFMPW